MKTKNLFIASVMLLGASFCSQAQNQTQVKTQNQTHNQPEKSYVPQAPDCKDAVNTVSDRLGIRESNRDKLAKESCDNYKDGSYVPKNDKQSPSTTSHSAATSQSSNKSNGGK